MQKQPPEVFWKKGAVRNFAKFTGKHLWQRLKFIKKACKFIKKESLAQVFFCEFCKIPKNTSLQNISGQLLWGQEKAYVNLPLLKAFG